MLLKNNKRIAKNIFFFFIGFTLIFYIFSLRLLLDLVISQVYKYLSEKMNYFDSYNWHKILSLHPLKEYNISEYFNILCPPQDYPDFLDKYISLPVMQRLRGIGLLCGTDWTRLYKNRFFYSRLDHSIGVALIIWHFTHDKAQTLAGLFHDVSTPVFSHVSDFRKGDALTQTVTEAPTAKIIYNDKNLADLLSEDGLSAEQVVDYHIYPIADNEIPCLSADRLEYMFPSGMALDGSWKMEEIKKCYDDITILKNENGVDELGFKTLQIAELYCRHFCMIGHILQLNENKLTLELLGQIMNMAEKEFILTENDFMSLSEKEVIEKLDNAKKSERLEQYYKTFRTMTEIEHTEYELTNDSYFCVSLKVKQRYINPLVAFGNYEAAEGIIKGKRLSEISDTAFRIIEDFKTYNDTLYGCVKLVK